MSYLFAGGQLFVHMLPRGAGTADQDYQEGLAAQGWGGLPPLQRALRGRVCGKEDPLCLPRSFSTYHLTFESKGASYMHTLCHHQPINVPKARLSKSCALVVLPQTFVVNQTIELAFPPTL
jgi:hypothetical protein